MELTIREKIIELLTTSKKPLSAYQIASLLGLEKGEEKRIYEEIAHASRSLRRRSGGRLTIVMIPPQCANCGYVMTCLLMPSTAITMATIWTSGSLITTGENSGAKKFPLCVSWKSRH